MKRSVCLLDSGRHTRRACYTLLARENAVAVKMLELLVLRQRQLALECVWCHLVSDQRRRMTPRRSHRQSILFLHPPEMLLRAPGEPLLSRAAGRETSTLRLLGSREGLHSPRAREQVSGRAENTG